MSLARAGKAAEAKAMLERRPDSLPVNNAYAKRLKLYRGEVGPDSVFTPADTADVQVATLSFGIGNWYLVRGDTANARRWFERSVTSGGWQGSFILSEMSCAVALAARCSGGAMDSRHFVRRERGAGSRAVDRRAPAAPPATLAAGGSSKREGEDRWPKTA
jgi:hypothetical protein